MHVRWSRKQALTLCFREQLRFGVSGLCRRERKYCRIAPTTPDFLAHGVSDAVFLNSETADVVSNAGLLVHGLTTQRFDVRHLRASSSDR